MDTEHMNKWLAILTNAAVVVGIALLVVELNQNAELMRAEIHAMRAEAKADRQMTLANSGEVIRIMSAAQAAGFPAKPEGLDTLNAEDRFRIAIFLEGLKEAVGNWHYQCQEGLLDEELCGSGYRMEVRSLVSILHGANINLMNARESFVADVRKIAEKEGMPVPNEDGTW